ncbi:ABC transporter permease [Clostridium estertheticum]|uniref:ABC transporter permease n=1 Tax=Clostridium estertheticum TaxID=238834 RepID=UPI001C6F4227|nr:FtsX-like permease family protein [Clostridium estertheticum]MBW9153918.1 hypothetical protein [Clostridium estertheticum]WLC86532.1 hypothetical protein KTC97_20570 [Clostridium estertheticum]
MTMGLGMHDSISNYLKEVKSSIPSEYVYLLNSEQKVEKGSEEKLKVSQFSYKFKEASTKMTITCYGLTNNSSYINVEPPGKNEIILADTVATKFGLKVGDDLKVDSLTGDKTYTMKIVGIHKFPNGLYAFMGMKELNALLGEKSDSYNAYFSDKKLNIDEKYVSGIVAKEDIIQSSKQYYDMTSSTVNMVIAAAVIIAVVLMFIIFEMTIDKNKTNISLTKILGYMPKEINQIYIGGKLLIVFIGIAIAIPLDYALLHSMWPSLIMTFRGFMPFSLTAGNMAIIASVEILAYLAIRVITSRGLEKVELTYVLKDRE